MKECKWCHEKMKEIATVCPHCQRNQKSHSAIIIIVVSIITLIIIALLLSSSFQSNDLIISNTKGKVSTLGVMEWEGDLTNKGYNRINDINIIITCYSGSREKTGLAYTAIQYIDPGETIHFNASGLGDYDKRNDYQCMSEIKIGKIELKDKNNQ